MLQIEGQLRSRPGLGHLLLRLVIIVVLVGLAVLAVLLALGLAIIAIPLAIVAGVVIAIRRALRRRPEVTERVNVRVRG
jgi:Flp pilus assembly protein TadB